MPLDVSECFGTCLLIKLILYRVILKSLVSRSFQIVSKGLQRRLQVVPVLHFLFEIIVHLRVVVNKEMRQVGVVFVMSICWMTGLKHESSLHLHELLAHGLVHLRKNWESFLVGQESIR